MDREKEYIKENAEMLARACHSTQRGLNGWIDNEAYSVASRNLRNLISEASKMLYVIEKGMWMKSRELHEPCPVTYLIDPLTQSEVDSFTDKKE